ncbi:MAG TPA: 16S rRNA (cytosine(1402)-N(4))-methyltransferase RsmH [Hyphomicrobiales bacterium]|nr:16S rRNA (cytosine(1402)-N(4))-methyltransferase RsmH [Hyphomicrobiales bacterium]
MAGRDTKWGVAGGPARHVPVMLSEVVAAIAPKDGGIYVDATFGAGGYTRAFLDAATCTVLALDRDPAATRAGAALMEAYPGRLILREGCYSDLGAHVAAAGLAGVDGVAFDIGVSSIQLESPERGFSFLHDGPLDMRMGEGGPTAADVVNGLPAADLARIIRVLGEEKRARAIARAIVEQRATQPITRTAELAGIVSRAVGGRAGQRIHPATRTFQALRVYVNRELEELALGLYGAEAVLGQGGRLAVVCFHSLEDRIVKRFIALASGRGESVSRHLPEQVAATAATFKALFRGAKTPSADEVAVNPRARSARLRATVRTDAPARPAELDALGLPALRPQHFQGGVLQ